MDSEEIPLYPALSPSKKLFLLVLSFFIVAFGQPAWSWLSSLAAAAFGYALFWRVLLDYPSASKRFWLSAEWFAAVQLLQLSWLLSHPYSYIYFLWIFLAFMMGLQFGLIGLLIQPKNFEHWIKWIAIPALWVFLEWGRLFVLSGFSFNPAGLALTAHELPLQAASLMGVFGLSFWVMLTNCLALKLWLKRWSLTYFLIWGIAVGLPYFYGIAHHSYHDPYFAKHEAEKLKPFRAVLVQTAFPVEESLAIWGSKDRVRYVIGEWKKILSISKKNLGKPIDLIAYPEFIVPFGTYTMIYPYSQVKGIFQEILGFDSVKDLPPLSSPFARQVDTQQGPVWFVNNAFWLQGIANIFQSDVISGLEDVEEVAPGKREYYSSAIYFQAKQNHQPGEENYQMERYEKRVLVPMGEYIPFGFLKELAGTYGIQSSFTCGKEAKVFTKSKIPFGASICYEETYGDMMRENRIKGAEMLVNLSSDVWYPNSKLIKQHFDHARLRTVEMGIPLIRACNTGITCGVDSLGRIVDVLGDNEEQEWIADSLYLRVPTYTYHTIYAKVGDALIVGLCALLLLISFVTHRYQR